MGIRCIETNRNRGENRESKSKHHVGDIDKRNPTFFQQFGLYDRPKLDSWHKGRVVLLGDAAHPTPPVCHSSRVIFPHESHPSHYRQHLGQGANQTFEDIYHLTRLLGAHPGAAEDNATLQKVFTEYERVRIPRSTMLIEMARKQGESRVVEGVEASLARNQQVRAFMSDEGVMALYAEIYGDLVQKRSAQL
jgi:salicylate hydroxylase